MRPIFLLTAIAALLLCSTAQAGCPCQRAEAPVIVQSPDQPICTGGQCSVLAGPILVEHQPVRNAGRVVAWEGRRVLRVAARVVTWPFRALRGGCCR